MAGDVEGNEETGLHLTVSLGHQNLPHVDAHILTGT